MWKQKAVIKLAVGSKHLNGWTEEKINHLLDKIRKTFSLNQHNSVIKIELKTFQNVNLEFSAMASDESLNTMAIVEAMERLFFDLDINGKQVIYERL